MRISHQSAQFCSHPPARLWVASWAKLAVAAVGLLISSCASVHSVTVSPSTACPGESVTLSWAASGRTELAAIPLHTAAAGSPGQALDFCVDALASGIKTTTEPSRGTLTEQASVDTVYLIQTQGWFGASAHKCATLFVNQVLPLSDLPQCLSGATATELRAAQVHLIRPNGSRWDASTTTGLVKNDNPVTVTIRHAGRSISLPPGAPTHLFEGTNPNSDWWVTYTWTTGPQCGLPGAPVPNSLSVEVHPLCPKAPSRNH